MDEKNFKIIVNDLHKRIFALEQELRPLKRLFTEEQLTTAFIHGKNDMHEKNFLEWKEELRVLQNEKEHY